MSVDEDLRQAFLTSGLTDAQRAELVAAGREQAFAAGDALFQEGVVAEHLWILLAGEVELLRHVSHEEIRVATMTTPGQWAGGLAAWGDGDGVYRASGRALTDGRVLVVPSAELSRLVGEWSPFAKHMVQGVYQTVRSIDAAARQRDSLVALGTLAAGLAHENNNPASASLRAVASLRSTCDYMLASLVGLAEHSVHSDGFLALDRLRVELQSRDLVDEDAIARSDREELIGGWMDDRGVDLAWQIAPVLTTRGVDVSWMDELESTVGVKALPAALRWISSAVGAGVLLDELAEATNRIAHLVADVKTYSQLDRAALQRVDVRDGIEATLVMLAPKLNGVDVERDYDPDVPEVDVYAAELNQVWTNLIDNAVDAMGGVGTLRIATRTDGDHLVVEFTDDGPGIPVELQARVFEPFFTTKGVGQGTGLGLDISRRIVAERHGGSISFDCVPGSTTARVRVPIRR